MRRAHLIMEFKNCYLKWYENCGLKSIVDKTKKYVWYHGLNNMFQCSKNIKMCLVCVCLILKKADTCTKYQFFNSRERIHHIFPLLLCVCSFFPSLLWEQKMKHTLLISIDTAPWSMTRLHVSRVSSPPSALQDLTTNPAFVTVDPSLQDPGSNLTFTLLGNGCRRRFWMGQ